jgi:hypothetical protein
MEATLEILNRAGCRSATAQLATNSYRESVPTTTPSSANLRETISQSREYHTVANIHHYFVLSDRSKPNSKPPALEGHLNSFQIPVGLKRSPRIFPPTFLGTFLQREQQQRLEQAFHEALLWWRVMLFHVVKRAGSALRGKARGRVLAVVDLQLSVRASN